MVFYLTYYDKQHEKEGVQRPFFFMLLNPFHKKMKEKVKSIPTCANIHAPTNTTASFIPR